MRINVQRRLSKIREDIVAMQTQSCQIGPNSEAHCDWRHNGIHNYWCTMNPVTRDTGYFPAGTSPVPKMIFSTTDADVSNLIAVNNSFPNGLGGEWIL